jgi:hypothetical protein
MPRITLANRCAGRLRRFGQSSLVRFCCSNEDYAEVPKIMREMGGKQPSFFGCC